MSIRNRRSAAARSWQALYATRAWRVLRQRTLLRDLYQCRRCGVMLAGKPPRPDSPTVHHRRPHKGDRALFFDPDNVEAICKACHDGAVQSAERRGYAGGVDPDGWPLDPAHPVNRRQPGAPVPGRGGGSKARGAIPQERRRSPNPASAKFQAGYQASDMPT